MNFARRPAIEYARVNTVQLTGILPKATPAVSVGTVSTKLTSSAAPASSSVATPDDYVSSSAPGVEPSRTISLAVESTCTTQRPSLCPSWGAARHRGARAAALSALHGVLHATGSPERPLLCVRLAPGDDQKLAAAVSPDADRFTRWAWQEIRPWDGRRGVGVGVGAAVAQVLAGNKR